MATPPIDNKTPSVPKSWDPNEMVGDEGVGEARYVKPGQELTYTIYFENKAGFDIADAQEVKVTNPLSEWLDWSTFEMLEVAFNNQNDVSLDGLANGASEVQMTGTNKYVRTTVEYDATAGVASWYLRVYDPHGDSEGYPLDGSGFLPSNDDTHRGEGHLTYRIKVREDAPANVVITNSASIVFDYNDPIETDPAWWNTVGTLGAAFAESEIAVDEGGTIRVKVSGGSADAAASVKVYLTYNTAAAADIDLKTAAVIDSNRQQSNADDSGIEATNLKFPLTLTWEKGEVGEKVVEIPTKPDKTVEDDEFFTLQLADAVGMEVGEGRVCTVTVRDPGYAALAAKVADGTATKTELSAWNKLQAAKAPYVRGLADPADGGKVSGSALCAAGKKVTLKATANKGFVFVGWVESPIAIDGDRLLPNAIEYIATTPSLVIDRSAKPAKNSATSTTVTGVDDSTTYYACFITSAEDKGSIAAAVDGVELRRVEDNAPYQTNIWAGVYMEWPVEASALSLPAVKVAGLPSGLKFTDKPVTSKVGSGKTAVTVTNVPANTIYGVPTAASKVTVDRKTGETTVTPSAVKVTVTTAGKSSQTYQVNVVVDALPAWAVGTFDGGFAPVEGVESEKLKVENGGVATLTVAANGKISGKLLSDGLTWALSAASFTDVERPLSDVESPSFLATVIGKSGKMAITNALAITSEALGADGARGVGVLSGDVSVAAYQNLWKIEPWKTIGKSFGKKALAYAILSDGSFSEDEEYLTSALGADVTGRVTLKFAASGSVSVSGEFVAGFDAKKGKYTTVKASGSATLVPVDDGLFSVFIYLTPKGLAPHVRRFDVPLAQ